MVESRTVSGTIADILIVLVLIGVMIVCFVPLWYVLVASVSDGKTMFATEGLILKPVGEWTLDGYKLILQDNSILIGYRNTLMYVVTATLLGLLCSSSTAQPSPLVPPWRRAGIWILREPVVISLAMRWSDSVSIFGWRLL